MLSQLPDYIQKEVLHYIQSNNFAEAKAIHDDWLKSHGLSVEFKEKSKSAKHSKKSTQQNDRLNNPFAEGVAA